MVKALDKFLNGITMYRLVMYGLAVLLVVGLAFSSLGQLAFSPKSLLLSVLLLLAACVGTNVALSALYGVPRNIESAYITALILCCILPPPATFVKALAVALTGVLAISSKFLLAYRTKHLLNPAAAGSVVAVLAGILFPSWWVGGKVMLLFVAILGFMVARKIRRSTLVIAFLVTALAVAFWLGHADGRTLFEAPLELVLSGPAIFFATIMLTEPLTMPPTKSLQIAYGVLVGLLFASRWHFGSIHGSPELALVIGNLFAFIVSPKQKLVLALKEKREMGPNVYDFVFAPSEPLKFTAGQYIEWTLPHAHPDGRGNRRYFTIASSPTESDVHLGVKFYEPSSSFKRALRALETGDSIHIGQLAGNFTLPDDPAKKLVLIAGGIGITPFRSMLKYCADSGQKRDIVLFYAVNDPAEVAYQDVLDEAAGLGVRVIFLIRSGALPAGCHGYAGVLTEEIMVREVPDALERTFYVSGPNIFVDIVTGILKKRGVGSGAIVKDYFPGY